jgi:hypothetical protein
MVEVGGAILEHIEVMSRLSSFELLKRFQLGVYNGFMTNLLKPCGLPTAEVLFGNLLKFAPAPIRGPKSGHNA